MATTGQFTFADERMEPLTDASDVRDAGARFDRREGASDAERDRARRRINAEAKKSGVEVAAVDWRELFDGGQTKKR